MSNHLQHLSVNGPHRSSTGFVALLSTLIVSAVIAAVTVAVLRLGVGALQTSVSVEQGEVALGLAHACAEEALQGLSDSQTYSSGESLTFDTGSCTIENITGSGGARTVQTVGTTGDATSRVQVEVSDLNPDIVIASWEEVARF